ncbi:hypothetical protein [Nocardioides pyridinolyticus]
MSTEQTPSPAQAASEFTLHAWVDESIHTSGVETPDGMYVLAAAVADREDCGGTREQLRDLVPRGAVRLHWRGEGDPRRAIITSTIASCDLINAVVVGSPLDHRRQERARRKCMQRLLHELEALGVSQVWVESRTKTLNRKDLQMVDALRGEGVITRALRVDFRLPSEEPMLWVPDAVAGAVSAARKGTETTHRKLLGEMVTEYEIAL